MEITVYAAVASRTTRSDLSLEDNHDVLSANQGTAAKHVWFTKARSTTKHAYEFLWI